MQTARIEIHSFETVTLADKQFLIGAKEGTPKSIGGELRLPPGTDPVPAVVLVHGSAGVGANVDRWAQELNGMGVAAIVLLNFAVNALMRSAAASNVSSRFATQTRTTCSGGGFS